MLILFKPSPVLVQKGHWQWHKLGENLFTQGLGVLAWITKSVLIASVALRSFIAVGASANIGHATPEELCLEVVFGIICIALGIENVAAIEEVVPAGQIGHECAQKGKGDAQEQPSSPRRLTMLGG